MFILYATLNTPRSSSFKFPSFGFDDSSSQTMINLKTSTKTIFYRIESFTFKQGITSVEVLFNLQKIGMGTKPIKWQIESLGFRNHFSPENNVKIARALYRTITNFDPAKNGTKQHLDLLDQDEK